MWIFVYSLWVQCQHLNQSTHLYLLNAKKHYVFWLYHILGQLSNTFNVPETTQSCQWFLAKCGNSKITLMCPRRTFISGIKRQVVHPLLL